MSDIERALAKVDALPLRTQVRVFAYAADTALDASKVAREKLDAEDAAADG